MTMAEIMPYFNISIHTPLAGSDHADAGGCERPFISIHTPLAGSDSERDYN